MKKQIFINACVALICMVVACLLNLLVTALIVKIVLSFADIGYFATSVMRAVIAFITCGAVMGAMNYRESFKTLEFRPALTVCSMLIAGAVHLGISLFLMFYPFIAGGTRYLAGALSMGSRFSSETRIDEIYLWAYLAAFGIYLGFEIVISLVFGVVGKKARLKNRESIKGYYDLTKETKQS